MDIYCYIGNVIHKLVNAHIFIKTLMNQLTNILYIGSGLCTYHADYTLGLYTLGLSWGLHLWDLHGFLTGPTLSLCHGIALYSSTMFCSRHCQLIVILAKILFVVEQWDRNNQIPYVWPRHDQPSAQKNVSGDWSTLHLHTPNWNHYYCCLFSKIKTK